jgi:hypothetical protein
MPWVYSGIHIKMHEVEIDSITCPDCGTVFKMERWKIINAQEHPELKIRLQKANLNISDCPGCNRKLFLEEPLLYRDLHLGFMVCVFPRREFCNKIVLLNRLFEEMLIIPMDAIIGQKVVFGYEKLARLLVLLDQKQQGPWPEPEISEGKHRFIQHQLFNDAEDRYHCHLDNKYDKLINEVTIFWDEARQACQDKKWEAAVLHYTKALRQCPRHSILLCEQGWVFGQLHEAEKGLDCYLQAVKLRPNDHEILLKISQLYLLLKKNETAGEYLRAAFISCPNHFLIRYNLGLHYHHLGRENASQKQLTVAATLAPTYSDRKFIFDTGRSLGLVINL